MDTTDKSEDEKAREEFRGRVLNSGISPDFAEEFLKAIDLVRAGPRKIEPGKENISAADQKAREEFRGRVLNSGISPDFAEEFLKAIDQIRSGIDS